MRVRIMPRLMGAELYGADDPEDYGRWLGKEATVKYVRKYKHWFVGIEEDDDVEFYMEEIECIIEDVEISESDESIDILLGGVL